MAAAQPLKRLAGQPSGRLRAAGALVAGLLLLGAGAALLGAGAPGGSSLWQAALGQGSLALGQGCPVQMCPPCPAVAETAAREQQEDPAQAAPMAQDCPPPPDCPATPAPQQCPECAACPAAAQCPPPAAGSGATQPANVALLKREQQERSGSDASAAAPAPEHALAAPEGSQIASGPAAEPLCGGPDAIPSVMDSLDAASAAVVAGLDEAFAPWAETGFTLEDLMATADALGAWGMHDCAVWIEARKAGGGGGGYWLRWAGPGGARMSWQLAAPRGAVHPTAVRTRVRRVVQRRRGRPSSACPAHPTGTACPGALPAAGV